MRGKGFKKAGMGLCCILAIVLLFSMNAIPVLAEEYEVSAQSGNVQTATEWSQVQGLIDAASENDIVDITALRLTTADTTLTISKNIVIKCEPTDKLYEAVVMKDLFFQISNNATLTLENTAIANTKLDTSIIRGTGNTVVSKSILQSDNANGTTTVYNAPATIDLQGDVTVKTDADSSSSSVAGATIIARNSGQTGKAGTAIQAVNVTVNGGHVVGGASFESNCNSGDGIIASGDVTVDGVRSNGTSNARVQSGTVGKSTSNTTVGLPIRFTENDEKQRVLSVHGGDVFGNTQSPTGSAAPYSVKMSKKDIAIIDNSKIGWYPDIPIFSDGFCDITNPINTWGTLANAAKVYPVTAVHATLSGAKAVTLGEAITHYAAENEQITVTADEPASGQQFKEWTAAENSVIFENSKNAITTFAMPAKSIEVTATFEGRHVHSPSTTWSKDATNHWHECTAADGEKMDAASHTYGGWIMDTPATENTAGRKHRDCSECAYRETATIPKLSSKDTIIDDTTGTKSAPKTADTSNAMRYLGLIALSGGIAVFCLKKKRA